METVVPNPLPPWVQNPAPPRLPHQTSNISIACLTWTQFDPTSATTTTTTTWSRWLLQTQTGFRNSTLCLDLTTGVKWFLKGINSPLGFNWRPLEGAGVLIESRKWEFPAKNGSNSPIKSKTESIPQTTHQQFYKIHALQQCWKGKTWHIIKAPAAPIFTSGLYFASRAFPWSHGSQPLGNKMRVFWVL